LDEALRRPGRFDRELYIGPPDVGARKEIIDIHTRNMPLENVDKDNLAATTHGYTGADIAGLCREAAMSSLRGVERPDGEDLPEEEIKAMRVAPENFVEAGQECGPSVLRDDAIDVPNITFDDIGGLEDAKQQLREAVEWPMQHADIFNDMNVKVPTGALLYGPPGTGKTMLAKAIAHDCGANFISVKGPEFLDKYVGETERKVRETFRKARQAAPCVVFFDEADAIMPVRGGCSTGGTMVMERTISTFLAELDGMEELNDVFVLAATNRPDMMDKALLRPGRLSRHIYIGAPD
jgi:transitional endoplasmic reticulum ATPase